MKKSIKYPCRSCKYYNSCGSAARLEPCEGRAIKIKRKKISKNR